MRATVGTTRRKRPVNGHKMQHVTNKMRHITKMTKARNKAVLMTRAVNSLRADRKRIAEERNRVDQATSLIKNRRAIKDTRAGNPSRFYAAGVRGGFLP